MKPGIILKAAFLKIEEKKNILPKWKNWEALWHFLELIFLF